MAELLKIAVSVTTPLSLLGLLVALGYLIYISRLKHEQTKLESLPPSKRARQTDEYLTRYGIHGKDLSPDAKLALIRDELEKRHRRSLAYVITATVAFVICFGIAGLLYVVHGNVPEDPYAYKASTGFITTPKENEVVEKQFVASGTVQNAGKGVYLWLAVETKGQIWPKGSHITNIDANGNWSQPVFEDGHPEEFELSLWATNNAADIIMQGRLDERDYSGMQPIVGMQRIRRVSGLRIKANP